MTPTIICQMIAIGGLGIADIRFMSATGGPAMAWACGIGFLAAFVPWTVSVVLMAAKQTKQ